MPGALGVVYDTAFRGVHHQALLRDLGLLPINRVTAKKASATKLRRAARHVPKTVHVEDKTITLPDGRTTVAPFTGDGAVGLGRLTDRADLHFTELRRVRTHRTRDKSGQYRW